VLADFLSALPRDIRHVFEFRHGSWFNSEVFALLRLHNVGFCAFHMVDRQTPMEATTDFAYMRFHGSGALYGGCYDEVELRHWAGQLRALPEDVEDVYLYFNNDAYGFAVQNAQEMTQPLAREG